MKKKLALLALTMTLPLAACGKKEEEQKGPESLGPVVNEQQAQALTESYFDFATLIMGEQQATAMKPFLLDGARVVSTYEVDIEKVYNHIISIGDTVDSSTNEMLAALGVYSEVSEMEKEGLIDDTVYYFLGFGDGMLKVAAQMGGNINPDATATLKKIDADVDKIGTNLCDIINAVLSVTEEAFSFALSAMSAVNTTTYEINPQSLKAATTSLSSIFDKLLPVRAKVEYLSDLVLPVANVVTNVPQLVNIAFNYVKVSDVVGVLFDAITFVADGLKSLDDEYFEYLGSIDTSADSYEQIVYAVLGLAENIKTSLVNANIDSKVEAAVDKVLELGLGMAEEIFVTFKINLPSEIDDLLKSDKLKTLLMASTQLGLDLLGFELKSVNAKSLAKIIGTIAYAEDYLYKSTYEHFVEPYDSLPDYIKAFIDSKYLTNGSHQEIGAEYCYSGFSKTTKYLYITMTANFDGTNYMVDYDTTKVNSLEPIVEPVYAILSELAEEDEKVVGILRDIYSMFNAGYSIFDEIKDFVDIDPEIIDVLLTVSELVSENSGSITTVVLDIFDVAKDLFGAFVAVDDQTPAELDFSEFIYIIEKNYKELTIQISESRLEKLEKLFEDVCTVLDELELLQKYIDEINSHIKSEKTIEDSEGLVAYFYYVMKSFLVDGRKLSDIEKEFVNE